MAEDGEQGRVVPVCLISEKLKDTAETGDHLAQHRNRSSFRHTHMGVRWASV